MAAVGVSPAGLVELAVALEVFRHGHDIAGTRFGDERTDRLEDQAMVVAVEIIGGNTVTDLVPGGGVEQQAAQDGLLGLDRMRWRAQ